MPNQYEFRLFDEAGSHEESLVKVFSDISELEYEITRLITCLNAITHTRNASVLMQLREHCIRLEHLIFHYEASISARTDLDSQLEELKALVRHARKLTCVPLKPMKAEGNITRLLPEDNLSSDARFEHILSSLDIPALLAPETSEEEHKRSVSQRPMHLVKK